jgi:hypothetical protein
MMIMNKVDMSESLLFNAKSGIVPLYHGATKLDNVVHFVLEEHTWLDVYSSSTLKQQSVGIPVALLIMIIPSQPVFAFTNKYCTFREDVAHTNCIGLYRAAYPALMWWLVCTLGIGVMLSGYNTESLFVDHSS